MDAKQLLKYAIEKLSASDLSDVLTRSGIRFRINGSVAAFSRGSLVRPDGSAAVGGIGSITGVYMDSGPLVGSDSAAAVSKTSPPDDGSGILNDPAATRVTSSVVGGGSKTVTLGSRPGEAVAGGTPVDHMKKVENIVSGGTATLAPSEKAAVESPVKPVDTVEPTESKTQVKAQDSGGKPESTGLKKPGDPLTGPVK